MNAEQEGYLQAVLWHGAGTDAQLFELFGVDDGRSLALKVLTAAVTRENPLWFELGLAASATYGSGLEVAPVLRNAICVTWHAVQDQVAETLGDLRDPQAVDVLYQATGIDPSPSGPFRSLAARALRALIAIDTPAARTAVDRLCLSEDPTITLELSRTVPGYRSVRAIYDAETILLYRAADDSAPIDTHELAWVTPSFQWIVAATQWTQDLNTKAIAGIRYTRSAFERLLDDSRPARYSPLQHGSKARWAELTEGRSVQTRWVPEPDRSGVPTARRCLTLGVPQGTLTLQDPNVVSCENLTATVEGLTAWGPFPAEETYPLSRSLRNRIGASRQD